MADDHVTTTPFPGAERAPKFPPGFTVTFGEGWADVHTCDFVSQARELRGLLTALYSARSGAKRVVPLDTADRYERLMLDHAWEMVEGPIGWSELIELTIEILGLQFANDEGQLSSLDPVFVMLTLQRVNQSIRRTAAERMQYGILQAHARMGRAQA